MAVYLPHGPTVLNVQITVNKASANGACLTSDVTVLTANGKPDVRYYGFVNSWGGVVLNFKEEGRQPKPEPKAKATPAAPAKAAPAKAAPSVDEVVAAVLAALQAAK